MNGPYRKQNRGIPHFVAVTAELRRNQTKCGRFTPTSHAKHQGVAKVANVQVQAEWCLPVRDGVQERRRVWRVERTGGPVFTRPDTG